MNVVEAIRELESGNRVRDVDWDEGHWIRCEKLRFRKYAIVNEYGSPHLELDLNCLTKWEIYQEPQKTYSFSEMIEGVRQGKTAKRKIWETNTAPVRYKYGFCLTKDLIDKVALRVFDIEATDWVFVEE
jgi:hypothetical protein